MPGGSSTYKELLSRSGLTTEKQSKFAKLCLAHQGTPAELWQTAQASGFTKEEIVQLRLQGKLAYLTHSNPDLMQSLQSDLGITEDLSLLVDMDLHTPEAWKTRIQRIAGK